MQIQVCINHYLLGKMEIYNLRNSDFIPNGKNFVLIVYDISDDKKRLKFSKRLLAYGFRVQKSAFEAFISNSKYNKLIKFISKMEICKTDSIRIYKFNGYGEVTYFGDCTKIPNQDVIVI